MSDVRLTWDLPTVTARQYPIAHVRIEFRVDESLPWTIQDMVDVAAVQELLFVDVQPGTFFYQAIVVDEQGQEGAPVETNITLAFDLPGSVENFLATEEGSSLLLEE